MLLKCHGVCIDKAGGSKHLNLDKRFYCLIALHDEITIIATQVFLIQCFGYHSRHSLLSPQEKKWLLFLLILNPPTQHEIKIKQIGE